MSREYSIPMSNVTVAGASTLVFLQVMATAPVCAIEFIRAWATQSSDTTSRQLRIQINTQVSTFPTLSAQAPVATKAGDPASKISGGTGGAAGTCGVNASAEGAGAKTVLYPDSFNILTGWLWTPSPRETYIETPQATAHGFGISFPASPSNTTGWNAGLVFAELG